MPCPATVFCTSEEVRVRGHHGPGPPALPASLRPLTDGSTCVLVIEGPKSNRGQKAGEVEEQGGGDVFAHSLVFPDDA